MKATSLVRGGFVFLATAILVAPAQAQESRDHVVIVLDCSGSMNQRLTGTKLSKMDAAKTALKAVLQKVPQSTQIGLIVFGLADQRQDWIHPLGPRNDAELSAAIDRLQPSSGTPLGAYIKKGTDRLLAERQKQFGYGTYRLLVVTDGEAQDQDLVNRFTPEVIARGITVDVIGVGMKQDHTLATKVHSYRGANDTKALDQALGEVFAEVRDGGNDAAETQAFAVIAPLPDGLADAMIGALANTPNTPIGENKVAPVKARQIQSQEAAPAPAATPAPPPPADPAEPVTSQEPSRKKRGSGGAVVVVMTVMIAVFASRAFRRRGRRR